MKASKPTTAFDMTVYSLCDKIDLLESDFEIEERDFEGLGGLAD